MTIKCNYFAVKSFSRWFVKKIFLKIFKKSNVENNRKNLAILHKNMRLVYRFQSGAEGKILRRSGKLNLPMNSDGGCVVKSCC